MIVIVFGLLFYANGIAFNLFASPMFTPDVVAFLVIVIAVFLTVTMLTAAFIEKRKGMSTVIDSNQTPDTVLSPVNVQESESKVQKENLECKNQAPNELLIEPLKIKKEREKIFCPACRKESSLPSFMADYLVNYGPTKTTKMTRYCPHCDQPIDLKQKLTGKEDLWKE